MEKETIVIYQESRIPFFSVKERHVERLRRELPEREIIWCRDRAQFLEKLPSADTVLCWQFRQEWFDMAPKLRRIGTPAAGRDFFKVTSWPDSIEILNGRFHGAIMAETAVGMILAFNRGILTAYRRQLEGDLWPYDALFESRLIAGSHAVILGFGRIGRGIGRMLKPFGVRITGIRRGSGDAPEWFGDQDQIRPLEALHDALADADHVIMVLPSDTGTDKLMGRKEFEAMPAHAVLYNLGRGNSVDEDALAEALRNKVIAGACLDVFAREPLTPESPLADGSLPGLVRLPHASAYAESYIDRYLDEFIEWLKN